MRSPTLQLGPQEWPFSDLWDTQSPVAQPSLCRTIFIALFPKPFPMLSMPPTALLLYSLSQHEPLCMLSHVWLFATSWAVTHQVPLSIAFPRQEYWSGLPFPSPGDLSHPGIEPRSAELQGDSLPLNHLYPINALSPLPSGRQIWALFSYLLPWSALQINRFFAANLVVLQAK